MCYSAADLYRCLKYIRNRHCIANRQYNKKDAWIIVGTVKCRKYDYNWCKLWVAENEENLDWWSRIVEREPELIEKCKVRKIKDEEDLRRMMYRYCEKYELSISAL